MVTSTKGKQRVHVATCLLRAYFYIECIGKIRCQFVINFFNIKMIFAFERVV